MGCSSTKPRFSPKNHSYNYDLIVIGGGSAGMACAREAAKYDAKVALIDYVTPSPRGSQWGLGGTCVNVGCIPKRLMHQASLIKDYMGDASLFGWSGAPDKPSLKWEKLVANIQDYIGSLNFGYRVALKKEKIQYYNGQGSFKDEHTVMVAYPDGDIDTITGQCIVISVGGRPNYLNIPGGRAKDKLCITSDDIFSLEKAPGKCLCIGAGYISVECAGFLASFGCDVTLMARSVILRGFDQTVVDLLRSNLTEREVKILTAEPKEIKKSGEKLIVKYITDDDKPGEDQFNTVLLAVGRMPCTSTLNIEAVPGIKTDKDGYIITDSTECTGVNHIFAIGDCASGRPKLTPTAIMAGRWLARRLYSPNHYSKLMNYKYVPTTIFTPIEYGTCGLSEEDATDKYGYDNLEIYQKTATPLEFTMNKRDREALYAKMVCLKGKTNDKEKVLGIHYLGPNAGDITQGFSIAVNRECYKKEFNEMIGIHPTCAEIFCEMNITKSSGAGFKEKNC